MQVKPSLSKRTVVEEIADRVRLPEPDLKNITVLTHSLPNHPILPWNHYDSPQTDEGEFSPADE